MIFKIKNKKKEILIILLIIIFSKNIIAQNYSLNLSDIEVCEQATNSNGSEWKSYVYNDEIINEAIRRDLSLYSCGVLFTKSGNNSSDQNYNESLVVKLKPNKIGQPVFCKYKESVYYVKHSKNSQTIDELELYLENILYRGLSSSCGLKSQQISLSDFCKAKFTENLNFCSNKKIDNTQVAVIPEKKSIKSIDPIKPTIKIDELAPTINIDDYIKITKRNFSISGSVVDDSNVFIEVDGNSVSVNNNSFTIKGSTSVGKNILKIVAFDLWGNETRKSITVERVIQTVSNDNSFEKLKPETLETKRNKNRIALIIGMEEYENMSSANYAQRDAELFIDYVQAAFGVTQSNIKYFINADTKIKFDIKRWLKKNVRKNTEVYVYFSGHGMALNNGQDLYLLTNDTQPDFVEETAFNRNEIFNDIAQYNPKSVIAFLDTCYSGAGRADGEMLLAMAKGLVVVDEQQQQLPDNFTLFTAASAQESAWSLPEAQHGTFSYFLMKGMEGAADLNGDKKLTNGELQEYLLDNVGRYAQQPQTPQMIGDPDQVLVGF